ncbi:MAG TPA: DNA polymerase ligase N-terminal domain-containing protein [Chitinophagaceae bacterium]|jgi:bifunctional non-homologous end joining protein LigD|nr:DNA polymerase ligase N-terminal domain-containing protein [Chitinophagaceae bacterium]
MIKELRTLHSGEPACQKRSDSDHLRFVIHSKKNEELKFDFTIELNGIRSWAVPDVPSMNPLDQRQAKEDQAEADKILEKSLEQALTEEAIQTWDKGNYIPIDDNGNILSEYEAIECLKEGALKFFLQGNKLVGEFVLMRRGKNSWLLMKRHDEFALYNYQHYEAAGV